MWSRGAAVPADKDGSVCRDTLVTGALLAVLVLPSPHLTSLGVGWMPVRSPRVLGVELHVRQRGSRAWFCPQQPGNNHGQCLWMSWGSRGSHPPPQNWRDNDLTVTEGHADGDGKE